MFGTQFTAGLSSRVVDGWLHISKSMQRVGNFRNFSFRIGMILVIRTLLLSLLPRGHQMTELVPIATFSVEGHPDWITVSALFFFVNFLDDWATTPIL